MGDIVEDDLQIGCIIVQKYESFGSAPVSSTPGTRVRRVEIGMIVRVEQTRGRGCIAGPLIHIKFPQTNSVVRYSASFLVDAINGRGWGFQRNAKDDVSEKEA